MLANIQMLRAFAALNVVLYHIIGISAKYGHPAGLLAGLEGWGRNGVDVFFVISGFIMVYIQHRNPSPPGTFLAKRIRRIVPIYWLLTGLIVGLYLLWPGAFRSFAMDGKLILSSLFFLTELQGGDPRPVLYVGWTLEYEMLFYAVFALGLLLPAVALQRLFVCAVLGALMLLGTDAIVIEFLFGMACAVAIIHLAPGQARALGGPAFALGVAGLLASLWLQPDWHRSLLYGVPAGLLVFGAAAIPQGRLPLPVFLGDASYSIYLVQVLTIPLFYRLATRALPDWPGEGLALACLAFTAAVGSAVYLMLERPLMARPRPRPVAAR